MDQHINPKFSFADLAAMGLSQAVDYIHGRVDRPQNYSVIERLPELKNYIDSCSKTPYFNLGSEQGEVYMERDWLIPKSATNPAARVHVIHRSDLDRASHNHPWNHVSVILCNGYFELIPSPTGQDELDALPVGMRDSARIWEPMLAVWRGEGDVVFRLNTDRHKLIVPGQDKPVSLFMTAKKSDEWGFFTPDGFIVHTEYLNTDVNEIQ